MHATTAPPKAAKPPLTPQSPRLVQATAGPAIEVDSSAMDVITQRAKQIHGLASCAACLTAVESTSGQFQGHELTEDALPSLNYLIMEIAVEIEDAADRLWEQYRQAAAIANGEVQS
jgi:hypothetical protein